MVMASEWFEIEAGESLRVYIDETTPTPTLSLEVSGPHGGLEVLLSIAAAERLCPEIRAMIDPDPINEE